MQPRVYSANEHHVREHLIDPDAAFVIRTLREAGFDAYLVGGGVRDLLLGREPKDFDISTSARPEEIKPLFRHCLLIGRRFRLAHVRFGRKVIETSTFRAGEQGDELVLRDNIWGNAEEDALRRDFTINGLFYDPETHEIIDYVGGFEDLKKNLLRCIGDPNERFRQDPVRMIRCLKFRARFGFEIEPVMNTIIKETREELLKSSPVRVLEEILRMLESGASEPFFQLLHEHKFLKLLFPAIAIDIETSAGKQIFSLLKAADELDGKIDRAVLSCSLIFPLLQMEIQEDFLDEKAVPNLTQIQGAVRDLVHDALFECFPSFTRRMRADIEFILNTQYRITPLKSLRLRKERLAKHPDFPHAVSFLRLRAALDPTLDDAVAEWKELCGDPKPRQRQPVRRRRRRR